MQVLVIGASRGIGFELVRQYRAEGAAVTATARDEAGLERLRALGASAIRLDVADAAPASALAGSLGGAAFDVALYNAGVYGPRTSALDAPSRADFDRVMHTNVLGAMRVLPPVAGVLAPGARVAVISSRMGSIGARAATSGWLYRASKAALNSVLKDLALALGPRAVCVALHPGWVRTEMGGVGAELTVEDSVRRIRGTLAALQAGSSGGFFDLDGAPLPW